MQDIMGIRDSTWPFVVAFLEGVVDIGLEVIEGLEERERFANILTQALERIVRSLTSPRLQKGLSGELQAFNSQEHQGVEINIIGRFV